MNPFLIPPLVAFAWTAFFVIGWALVINGARK